jgi:hypothetical protein
MAGLRIVHAIRSDGFSGVERFVLRLASAQSRAGHRVHVIGGDEERMRMSATPPPPGRGRSSAPSAAIAPTRTSSTRT